MRKGTWDIGVVKVIKSERNQAIALALGGKCRKQWRWQINSRSCSPWECQ